MNIIELLTHIVNFLFISMCIWSLFFIINDKRLNNKRNTNKSNIRKQLMIYDVVENKDYKVIAIKRLNEE